MAAKQRGDAIRIVTLAHQTESMARIPKRLPQLGTLLKRLQKPRKGRKADQSDAVAALLERLAAKGRKKSDDQAQA